MIEAFAACRPVAWARPRVGRNGGMFTSASAERGARDQAIQFARFTPREPLEGPLVLRLVYRLQRPKRGKEAGPHDRRPDIDNLAKLTLDVLSRLRWWNDDAQVAELHVRKVWASVMPTGVHVYLSRAGDRAPPSA